MIRLEQVAKYYGPLVAVDHVDLDVPEGDVCVLLGPSGCGKTTTMRMINHLIEPTAGRIFVEGRDTAGVDPVKLRRSIGYVIQQIGLFPNMTIEDNICVTPDLLRWPRAKSRARAAELLSLVNLDPGVFLKRYPKELSGGQQQRVGVVRALAADPPVLLMDEPFGAIDPINRELIQDEFLKLQSALKKTVVLVSHDIDEAVKLASRIAIFRNGRIVQYDTPDAILARPADSFVSDFVGSDRTLKRLRLVRVEDAMIKEPISVTPEDLGATALERMRAHGHGSIVVVDGGGCPIGLARADALAGAASGARVGEHLLPLLGVLSIKADLRTAVSEMFTHGATWLACADDDGVFRGYVSQASISHMLAAPYPRDVT